MCKGVKTYKFICQIHCNTVPSFRNTIVYSNNDSSQRIQFRNHFDESTVSSFFPKRFFRRLVERLKLLNMRFKISKMDVANKMLPSVASDTLYLLQGTFKDLYVHLSIYTAIYSMIGVSGNESDIHLPVFASFWSTYTAIQFHLS